MKVLVDVLNQSPLLLLFLIVALGWPLGKVKIAGASLGMAAVLFVGVGLGCLPGIKPLPDIIYLLGLSLFVYSVGLSSAQGFFAAIRLAYHLDVVETRQQAIHALPRRQFVVDDQYSHGNSIRAMKPPSWQAPKVRLACSL